MSNISCPTEAPTLAPTLSEGDKDLLLRGKIIVLVVIGIVTFLASLIPWLLNRVFKKAMLYLSIGSCFASGIIIGAAFSHALPDAQEGFSFYFEHNENVIKYPDYPFAELTLVGVLILLTTIDKIFVEKMEKRLNHKNGDTKENIIPMRTHSMSHSRVELMDSNNDSEVGVDNKEEKNTQEQNMDGIVPIKEKAKRISQAYIFLIALSVHSVFDGLGIGAEQTVSGFYGLLITVVAHKLLDGFALGVPIFFAKFSTLRSMLFLGFAASMTPLGIGIGLAVTESFSDGDKAQLASGIILAMTSGSFIFISLMELLPMALKDGEWIKIKMFALFLGWAIMAVIALWV
eukprot:TRINITY_DN8698_c0_g1_i2.p1 TRINITY_DN8698_c0_g1~~TRINITY_DN8698_c0_g1_i2.p1  ORF type:complete len:345 (+),score=39.44 TRINITY_DN8698_c0_g1_i2:62-1096(+)